MFSMKKKIYKNRIRVILVDKMVTKTYLAEQFRMSKLTISQWNTNTTQSNAPLLIETSQVL